MSSPLLRVLSVAALCAASCSSPVTPSPEAVAGAGGTSASAGAPVSAAGTGTSGGASVTPPSAGNGGVGVAGNPAAGGRAESAGSGGAAGHAGIASSGGPAGGGGAGGSTSACAGLFCEDFESGALDPAVWTVQANQGQTVKVQADLAVFVFGGPKPKIFPRGESRSRFQVSGR